MKKTVFIVITGILMSTVIGCTSTEQGAGIGALSGAGLGAIIGHQSGEEGEGAAVGAAAGTILGGAIGQQKDKQAAAQGYQQTAAQQQLVKCPQCSQVVDVTGLSAGQRVKCPQCGGVFEL